MGKIDNKNVFVPYAVPGEKLEIEITQSFRDYDEAKIVKVLEASPKRVLPACPLYGKCGGCNLMHIDWAYQTELKAGILAELMERAGVRIPKIQTVSGSPLGYRSRFQLHDGGMEGRGTNDDRQLPRGRRPDKRMVQGSSDGPKAKGSRNALWKRKGRARTFHRA